MRERALDQLGDPVALHGFAPSMVDDPRSGRGGRGCCASGVSRSGMRQLLDTWEHLDVRGALPSIHLPTLVMCRSTDRMTPFAWNQYLADHIDGARLVDLGPGDHIFFTGDTEPILRELHDFITGTPGGRSPRTCWRRSCSPTSSARRSAPPSSATPNGTGCSSATTTSCAASSGAARPRGQAARRRLPRVLRGTGARDPLRAGDRSTGVRQLGLEIRGHPHAASASAAATTSRGMAVTSAPRRRRGRAPARSSSRSTVRDLVVGSGIEFADRGAREFKGVPGERRLYALRSGRCRPARGSPGPSSSSSVSPAQRRGGLCRREGERVDRRRARPPRPQQRAQQAVEPGSPSLGVRSEPVTDAEREVERVGGVADHRGAVAQQRVGPARCASPAASPGTAPTSRPRSIASSAVISDPDRSRGLDHDRRARQRGDDPVARREAPAQRGAKPGGISETTAPRGDDPRRAARRLRAG